MDSSTAHQEMGLQKLESMLSCTKTQQQEKKPRPADMQALKCPRCDSSNTKFCYYNNYSLSQPRYFCKSCRRYWTKGGTLRNVPVGGGCRKNKRSSSSSSSSKVRSQDQHITPIPSPSPSITPLSYDSNDLSLAIARLQKQNSGHLGLEDHDFSIWGHPNLTHHHHHDDVLGNYGGNAAASSGLFDAIRIEFLENSSGGNGIQNMTYGIGNQEMGTIPYEEYGGGSMTAVKQEMRSGGDGRILWGLPWQSLGGEGNGICSPNWQGLLNSPLM